LSWSVRRLKGSSTNWPSTLSMWHWLILVMGCKKDSQSVLVSIQMSRKYTFTEMGDLNQFSIAWTSSKATQYRLSLWLDRTLRNAAEPCGFLCVSPKPLNSIRDLVLVLVLRNPRPTIIQTVCCLASTPMWSIRRDETVFALFIVTFDTRQTVESLLLSNLSKRGMTSRKGEYSTRAQLKASNSMLGFQPPSSNVTV
jgi:hypothetical protein